MKYLDLGAVNALHAEETEAAALRVMRGGWYLRGRATAEFEAQYARYIGTDHCVCCANGLDALTLILRACIENGRLREGDSVLVPANTYIATILSITRARLTPVLVEPDPQTLQIDPDDIERRITPQCRALMTVHLYGFPAYSDRIADICRRHSLLLFEDNAQAAGATAGNRRTGSLGLAAAHSFYPGKNLGALGDAGAITTSDTELADTARSLANYGSSRKYVFPYQGINSRIDDIQAAILAAKLPYLDTENDRRRQIAARLCRELHRDNLRTPPYNPHATYHIFPILTPDRDRLQARLAAAGIETLIHYPIPPHRQACYPSLAALSLPITERIHREELSLPCNQTMTDTQVQTLIAAVNNA